MTVPNSAEQYTVTPCPYPARTKTKSANIGGIETTATCVDFTDKILVTITQRGRLAHWVDTIFETIARLYSQNQVHVPLDIAATDASATSNAYLDQDDEDPSSELLPMHQLTATTVLGGTIPELDVLGQTLSTQIASAIKTRIERESRMVILGTGLDKTMRGRMEFSELVGLVLEVV